MAFFAVTYTFANATVADATQVNTNFQDVVDALSDGTNDISIAGLTAAGNAVFNGNVTLGNSSGDDVTITGSLAASISIKTQRTYNIGAADFGLAILYLGGNSTHTAALQAPSSGMSGDTTFALPPTNGSAGNLLTSDGSGNTSWIGVTTMSDVLATSLGFKPYIADLSGGANDTAYSGGVKATVSLSSGGGTLTTVNFAQFIPYQMQDGTWRLKLNLTVTLSSTGRTSVVIAINGVTFFNTGADGQALTGHSISGGVYTVYCRAIPSAGTIAIVTVVGTTDEYMFSGDVKLASKPTWAY